MYNVFKIQPCKSVHGPESAIIIFRIKPCYTFGHTKRLRLFTRPRARETCTHLSRIISDAWEKKFSRNFLEWENLDFSIVFHIGLLFHTNHKKRHKNQNVTFLQQPRSNEDISHPRNIRHTSLFSPSFLFSPFIYSPLHSNTTDLLFYSNFAIALSLSHCNQPIHFPEQSTVYIKIGGHRPEALDHRSQILERVRRELAWVSRDASSCVRGAG